MNAQPLIIEGKEHWYCAICKRVYKLKVKAEDCCAKI